MKGNEVNVDDTVNVNKLKVDEVASAHIAHPLT